MCPLALDIWHVGLMTIAGLSAWKLSLVLLLAWAALRLGDRMRERFEADAIMTWWDPADTPDGTLTWNGLHHLVARDVDPIRHSGWVRPGVVYRHVAGLVVIGLLVGVASSIVAGWLSDPGLPEFLRVGGENRAPVDALVNLSGNLTALLALLAAAASIWFANSQLRAKVRADNRQEWLGGTRTLLAEVVALARERAALDPDDRASVVVRSRIDERLDPRRLRFELMLNPREKDHRLLMHLLRRLAFLGQADRADRADGGAFVPTLRADVGNERYEVAWKGIVECDGVAELTTYVMRLGHVVLKREWERVKAAR